MGSLVKGEYALITVIMCIALLSTQAMSPDSFSGSHLFIPTSDDTLYTWHDLCTNTSGWIQQTPIDGFSIDGNITYNFDSLQTTSNGLTVPTMFSQSLPIYGPLFVKSLPSGISLFEIQDFRVLMRCTFELGEIGSMKVYLYDNQKECIFVIGISDSDEYSLGFSPIINYHPLSGSIWYSHDNQIGSSWEDYFHIWYDTVDETLYSLIDHAGDTQYKDVVNYGQAELDRDVKYIGISWTSFYDFTYSGARLELCDIQMTYRNITSSVEPPPTNSTSVTETQTTTTIIHPPSPIPTTSTPDTTPTDFTDTENFTPQLNPAAVAVALGSSLVIIIFTLRIISFTKSQ